MSFLAGAPTCSVLLIARFFRWINIRTLVRAELPRVESVGGEFAGAKAEVKLFGYENSGLDHRLADLEDKVNRLAGGAASEDGPRRKRK